MSEQDYSKLDEKLNKIYGDINNQLNIQNSPFVVEGDEIQPTSARSRESRKSRQPYDDDNDSLYSDYSERSVYSTGSFNSRRSYREPKRHPSQEYSYTGSYTQSVYDDDEFSSVSNAAPQSYYSDYSQNSYTEDEMSYTGSDYSYASSKYSDYSQRSNPKPKSRHHGRRMMNNFLTNPPNHKIEQRPTPPQLQPYYEHHYYPNQQPKPHYEQHRQPYPPQQQQYPPPQQQRHRVQQYPPQRQPYYGQQYKYTHPQQRPSSATSTHSIPLTENLDDMNDDLSSVYSSVSQYSSNHVRPMQRERNRSTYQEQPEHHTNFHTNGHPYPNSQKQYHQPPPPQQYNQHSEYSQPKPEITHHQDERNMRPRVEDIHSEDTLSSLSTPSSYVSRHSYHSERGPPPSYFNEVYAQPHNGMVMHELKNTSNGGGPPLLKPPPLRLNEVPDYDDVASTTSSSISTTRKKRKKKKKRSSTTKKSVVKRKRSVKKGTIKKSVKKKKRTNIDDDNISNISSSTAISTTSSTRSKRKKRKRSKSRKKSVKSDIHPSWTRKTMPNRSILKYFVAGKIKFESSSSNKIVPFKHRDRWVMITPEQISMLQVERQKKIKQRQFKRMQDAKNHANKISLISAKYLEKYKRSRTKDLVGHTVIQYASQRVNAFLRGWVIRFKIRRQLEAVRTIQHWWKRVVPTRRKFMRYLVNLTVSRHRASIIELVQDRLINYAALCNRNTEYITERMVPMQACVRQVVAYVTTEKMIKHVIFTQSHLRRSHVSECIEVDVLEKKLAYIKMNILKRYAELNAPLSRRATFCYKSRTQTKGSYFLCLREYNYLMNKKDQFMERKTFHHHLQFVLKQLKNNRTPNMEKIVRGVFEEDMKDLIENRSSVVQSVFRKIKSFGRKKKKKTVSNSLALAGSTNPASQPFAESVTDSGDQIDMDILLLKLVPEMFSTRYSISHSNWCGLLILTFVVNNLISPNSENFDIPIEHMLEVNGTEKIDYNIK